MVSTASSRAFIGLIAAALLAGFAAPVHAKEFLKGERPQTRGYSQAVITEGGKIVWLAGQLAVVDDSGKSLAGDLDGQVRQIFKLLNATLEKAGGKLSDMVQMTVFITDVRYGDRLTQLRREILGDNFPGSALITVTALGNIGRQFPRQRPHHRHRLGHPRGQGRNPGLRRHRQQVAAAQRRARNAPVGSNSRRSRSLVRGRNRESFRPVAFSRSDSWSRSCLCPGE